MRNCQYIDSPGQRKRKNRKPVHHRAFCRRIILSVLACGCLAALAFTNDFFGNDVPSGASKQWNSSSIVSLSGQKNFLPVVSSSGGAEENAGETAWCLILVNKWNPIPDDYHTELTVLSNGESVDKRIYPALQAMFDAARAERIYPIVASGYRTAKKQQSLLDEKYDAYTAEGCSPETAKDKAEAWVAVPGTSEHQLGIAVDINADGIHSKGDEVYAWLSQNAYKFGFIRRYPPDKTEKTGVINEPWHYRYVGIQAAAEIQNQGVCLEEYLEQLPLSQN